MTESSSPISLLLGKKRAISKRLFNCNRHLSADIDKKKILSISISELNKIIGLLKSFQGNCVEVHKLLPKFTLNEIEFIKALKHNRCENKEIIFTPDEDEDLFNNISKFGNDFKKISKKINKPITQTKWRYKKFQVLSSLIPFDKLDDGLKEEKSYEVLKKVLYSDKDFITIDKKEVNSKINNELNSMLQRLFITLSTLMKEIKFIDLNVKIPEKLQAQVILLNDTIESKLHDLDFSFSNSLFLDKLVILENLIILVKSKTKVAACLNDLE